MASVEILVVVCLAASALIHLIPLAGAGGAASAARLYDIAVDGPDLSLLLVHRAVMFGIFGAALVAATIWDEARLAVIVAVLVSDLAFLLIARLQPGLNAAMKRVVRADAVSIVLLVAAGTALLAS